MIGNSGISCNTSAHREIFEGNGRGWVDGERRRTWFWICMHRQSFARSTNTLICEHLVLPARRSRTRGALCRYAYVRKNLITVGASSLIGQTVVTTAVLFSSPLLSLFPASYASTKDKPKLLQIKKIVHVVCVCVRNCEKIFKYVRCIRYVDWRFIKLSYQKSY